MNVQQNTSRCSNCGRHKLNIEKPTQWYLNSDYIFMLCIACNELKPQFIFSKPITEDRAQAIIKAQILKLILTVKCVFNHLTAIHLHYIFLCLSIV